MHSFYTYIRVYKETMSTSTNNNTKDNRSTTIESEEEEDEPSLSALTADECSSSGSIERSAGEKNAMHHHHTQNKNETSRAFVLTLEKARKSTSMADEDLLNASFDECNDDALSLSPDHLTNTTVQDSIEKEQDKAVGTLTSSLARITRGMSELVCVRTQQDLDDPPPKPRATQTLTYSNHSKSSISKSEWIQEGGLCIYCGQCGCLTRCSCSSVSEHDEVQPQHSRSHSNASLLDGSSKSLDPKAVELEESRLRLEKDVTWLLGCASNSDVTTAFLLTLRSCLFGTTTGVFCGDGNVSTSKQPQTQDANDSTLPIDHPQRTRQQKKISIHNRSVILRAQAERIRRLKSDMHFGADDYKKMKKMSTSLTASNNKTCRYSYLLSDDDTVDLSKSMDDLDDYYASDQSSSWNYSLSTSLHRFPSTAKQPLVRNRCVTEGHVALSQEQPLLPPGEGAPVPVSFTTPSSSCALFYDSDPGEMPSSIASTLQQQPSSPKRYSSKRRRRRSRTYSLSSCQEQQHDFYLQSSSLCNDEDDYDDDEDSIGRHDVFTTQEGQIINKPLSFMSSPIPNVLDDESVSQFIKELKNGSVTLVYHPCSSQTSSTSTTSQQGIHHPNQLHHPSSSSNHHQPQYETHIHHIRSSTTPVCVQAWFEMGSRLPSKLIQPKFMWRVAYQPDLHHKKKLHPSCVNPDSVELLNIIRVIVPTTLDRSLYPFAKLKHSFWIVSNDQERYLFEANSQKGRDTFVLGLKLVIARLASKIIVGNEDVFDEFFTPWGGGGIVDDFYGNGDDDGHCDVGDEEYKSTYDEDDDDDDDYDDDDFGINDYNPKDGTTIQENASVPINPLVATATRESQNVKQLWGMPWRSKGN
mmetsp:Transcript_2523/g.3380  ORF Transcript_2523/g.3380 Transcript_2523/m.3380 type:complete len:864 (-) Transcript_2523:178-2769(-)